jgi:3-oxoacyl-[acyl-carrier-protein] synthase II
MQRVFITACGTVSALGFSLDDINSSFVKAASGIRKISLFDTARLKTDSAGQVSRKTLFDKLRIKSIKTPFFRQPVTIEDNPKLAFALWACARALNFDFSCFAPGAHITSDSLDSIVSQGLYRPDFNRQIKIYSTAGLEKIDLNALEKFDLNSPENYSSSNQNDRHDRHDRPDLTNPLCPEIPPCFTGRVLSWFFNCTDYAPVTFASACAASTQAIGEAFRDIKSGLIPLALAGGTDSMLFEFGINAFNSIGALAEKEHASNFSANASGTVSCIRPFDKKRSGTLLGEGAAYFLLESENSLKASKNIPLAEIIGYASSLDAFHPVKPHPGGEGAARAIAAAIEDSGLKADSITYINAHGSGTRHNDTAETLAIKSAFKEKSKKIKISSTKPFHGHLLTAGGAMETAAVLSALKHNYLPFTLNLTDPDPECDLDYMPFQSSLCSDFQHNSKVQGPGANMVCMNNSFGLNGQNGVLIIKKSG